MPAMTPSGGSCGSRAACGSVGGWFKSFSLLTGAALTIGAPVAALAAEASFTGQIDGSQTFVRPALSTLAGNVTSFTVGTAGGGDSDVRGYVSQQVSVNTGGLYTFDVTTATVTRPPPYAPGGDTVLFLYESAFDPANPLTGLLVANDDKENNANYLSRIDDFPLEALTPYVIVATFQNPEATGTLGVAVNGPGSTGVEEPDNNAGIIDTRKPFFTESDSEAAATRITFAGGTLRPATALVVQRAVVVENRGGTINTNATTLTLTNQVTGSGQLTVTGGGRLVLSGNSANQGGFVVQNATLSVNGTANGPVTVRNNGILRGIGRVSGATRVTGTLAPGNSPGTMVFTAPVTLSANAVLSLDIDGPGTGNGAGNYSRIVLTGSNSRFTADGSIRPVLRGITGSASNAYTPAVGDSFTVVQAQGGVSGQFDRILQPTQGLPANSRFSVVYGARTIRLVVAPVAVTGAGTASGFSQNQQAARSAIARLSAAAGSASGDQAVVVNAVSAVSAAQLPAALDRISGQAHADTVPMEWNTRRAFGATVAERLAQKRRSPAASATTATAGAEAAESADWQMWGQSRIAASRRDSDDNGAGFTARSGALFLGTDLQPTREMTLGLGLGYARGRLDGRHNDADSRTSSYQLSAYGQYAPGPLFMTGHLGYGYSAYDTRRTVRFGAVNRIATGEGAGHAFSGELGIGSRLSWGELAVEPLAGLRYDGLSRRALTEQGAGSLSLAVPGSWHHALRTSLGVSVSQNFALGDMTLTPEGRIAWSRELLDTAAKTDLALSGVRFAASSASSGRDAAVVGFGLSLSQDEAFRLTLGSQAEFRRNDVGMLAHLGARITW